MKPLSSQSPSVNDDILAAYAANVNADAFDNVDAVVNVASTAHVNAAANAATTLTGDHDNFFWINELGMWGDAYSAARTAENDDQRDLDLEKMLIIMNERAAVPGGSNLMWSI
jgi:hypothetical protein